ncbi:MAG: NAD-dependent epimerase/dehydratase family protein [Sulfuriferula sp.]
MLTFTPTTASALREEHRRLLITGVTGWLGRALLEMLSRALGPELAERVILCGSRAQSITILQGQILPVVPLSEGLALLGDQPVWVFHFAFLTKDRVGCMSEQDYINRNRDISDMVADIVSSPQVDGVMLASSGAVYDHLSSAHRDRDANVYGMLKAEDEKRYGDICADRGVRFIAPRIFNISGPHINKFDGYALSAIIVDALRGGPIRLRASSHVYRSYFYIGDLLELAMCRLLDRGPDLFTSTFDTAGDEMVEIGELAQRVCQVLNRPGALVIRPELDSSPDDRYMGNPSTIRAMLHQYGIGPLPLDRQISATANFIAKSLGAE